MNRILVALDGSAREKGVLAASVGLARKLKAKLVLFRAIGMPHDLPAEAYAIAPKDVEALLSDRATKAIEALAKDIPKELIEKVYVHVGTPWDAICRAAKDENVDAIVIGSHGYDTFDRILGTTASKVVNHADRTVIVMRAPSLLE